MTGEKAWLHLLRRGRPTSKTTESRQPMPYTSLWRVKHSLSVWRQILPMVVEDTNFPLNGIKLWPGLKLSCVASCPLPAVGNLSCIVFLPEHILPNQKFAKEPSECVIFLLHFKGRCSFGPAASLCTVCSTQIGVWLLEESVPVCSEMPIWLKWHFKLVIAHL